MSTGLEPSFRASSPSRARPGCCCGLRHHPLRRSTTMTKAMKTLVLCSTVLGLAGCPNGAPAPVPRRRSRADRLERRAPDAVGVDRLPDRRAAHRRADDAQPVTFAFRRPSTSGRATPAMDRQRFSIGRTPASRPAFIEAARPCPTRRPIWNARAASATASSAATTASSRSSRRRRPGCR